MNLFIFELMSKKFINKIRKFLSENLFETLLIFTKEAPKNL
jgi:hypothetical protein